MHTERHFRHFFAKLTSLRLALLLFLLVCSSLFGLTVSVEQSEDKCLPSGVWEPVSTSLKKLIPVLSPSGWIVQFKTDVRIGLSPLSPVLVPFMARYHTLASRRISQSKDSIARSGMTLYFNAEYEDFLENVGQPIACISYYAGAADSESILEVHNLRNFLQTVSSSILPPTGIDHRRRKQLSKKLRSMKGKELIEKLGLLTDPKISGTPPKLPKWDSSICDKIFWTLKDGTIVANLPVMDNPPKEMRIPGVNNALQVHSTNLTFQIARYFYHGLNCLNVVGERMNFSATVSKWISVKLVPQLMQNKMCIEGFPGMLKLMAMIEKYPASFKNNNANNVSRGNFTQGESFIQKPISDAQEIPKTVLSKPSFRRRREIPATTSKQIHKTPKKEIDRLLYDSELRHLYDKLNGHFLKNNLKIARLDVVKLPTETHEFEPQPIYFHLTTTTTTTTTTTVPTTEAEEEEVTTEGNYDDDYEISSEPPFETQTIGHRVKIVGELDINEEKLNEPVSVYIQGEKVRARLDVEPMSQVDSEGNSMHFSNSQPELTPHELQKRLHSRHPLHHHNHTSDGSKIHPLHMRQFIIQKKEGKDPNPPNFLAKMVNDGVHGMQNLAHKVLPSVFHGNELHMPKSHKFHSFEEPEKMHYLQHRQQDATDEKKIEAAFKHKLKDLVQKRRKQGQKLGLKHGALSNVGEGLEEIHDVDREFAKVNEADYYHHDHDDEDYELKL